MSDWRLTPQNSALVVIDVQEKLLNLIPRRAELMAGITKLITAARVLNLPVVATAQYPKGLGPVVPEIQADALEKTSFSCCGSEAFTRKLKDLRRQRILLCGIEAHVCVQQTAIDLMKDYFVYVVADAIASRQRHDHKVAVERLRDCGAVITTVESAIFELLRESGTEAFKQILPLFK